MFDWKPSYEKPNEGKLILCYCPEWSSDEYHVARYSRQNGYYYEDQPNDRFNVKVQAWTYITEY